MLLEVPYFKKNKNAINLDQVVRVNLVKKSKVLPSLFGVYYSKEYVEKSFFGLIKKKYKKGFYKKGLKGLTGLEDVHYFIGSDIKDLSKEFQRTHILIDETLYLRDRVVFELSNGEKEVLYFDNYKDSTSFYYELVDNKVNFLD
jgi:hypothetical protein